MKRFILVLVMALVANWVGGAWVSLGLAASAHDMDPVVAAVAPCHDHAAHSSTSQDTTSPHQRHACCPGVGLPHTLPQLHLPPASSGLMSPPTVHAYADVIFSIDKPPKASV